MWEKLRISSLLNPVNVINQPLYDQLIIQGIPLCSINRFAISDIVKPDTEFSCNMIHSQAGDFLRPHSCK